MWSVRKNSKQGAKGFHLTSSCLGAAMYKSLRNSTGIEHPLTPHLNSYGLENETDRGPCGVLEEKPGSRGVE